MTCIAAIRTPKGTLLGADSAVDFGTHTGLVDDKLFLCGGLWAGGAGDALALQYMRHGLPPLPRKTKDPLGTAQRMWAKRLVAIREELTSIDDSIWGELIIAHPDVLMLATIRGEVLPLTRGYAAIGSGAEYAMAIMHRLADRPPVERITEAIMTACEFVPGSVRPPVRMQWTK